MNAIRLIVIGLMLITAVAVGSSAHAQQFILQGNGDGSQNSLNIEKQQTTTVVQENNASFSNDINANANTGGNSISDGNGGTIKTGDAKVVVDVKNKANTNNADVECCKDGKTTPTPTLKPGQSPTPTPPGGIGGNGNGGNGGNGGGGGGNGGVGGAEVRGLSAASGENIVEIIITSTGIICLLAGAYLTRKNHTLA